MRSIDQKIAEVADNTAVTISKKRMNGLILRTAQQGTKYNNITLDIILRDAGILELSSKELERELKKMGAVV